MRMYGASDEEDEEVALVSRRVAAKRKRQVRQMVVGASSSSVEGAAKVKNLKKKTNSTDGDLSSQNRVSLVEVASKLRADPNFEAKKRKMEEEKFLATVKAKQIALTSAKERAAGNHFMEQLVTGWRPTRKVQELTKEECARIRKENHILVDGEDIPPPALNFWEMRLPKAIRNALAKRGINNPTPIQIQGLPVALSGRDMIGIAFTGSGKTITFTIPLILLALGMEMKNPVVGNEGPFGLIMGPSRELQTQTFEVIQYFCDELRKAMHPEIRSILAIGGQNKATQLGKYGERGAHIVVGTPGRIIDFLSRKDLNLDVCRAICLDESDRMISEFEEELQTTLGYCKLQRQMLLFSATMPTRLVQFAQTSLVKPITVNASRAGAANLNVIQEFEFIRDEARIVQLLDTLQKTPPPVVIFTQSKKDADEIFEYLLLKGVEAVATHGDKSQQERTDALKQFKAQTKDVLVATDIAAKGLDIENIQHVINFDMPKEIENYVHRIGRTGRGGRTGVATTFINRAVDTSLLLDLKHLLLEAKQRIPPAMLRIQDPADYVAPEMNPEENLGDQACAFCGGLGHRITNCLKLQNDLRKEQAKNKDVVGSAAFGGNY